MRKWEEPESFPTESHGSVTLSCSENEPLKREEEVMILTKN